MTRLSLLHPRLRRTLLPLVLLAAASAPVPLEAQEGGSIVYLVRHAETAPDPAAPSDPPLSDSGRERARALATLLADAGLTTVLSTDFRRTRGTAEVVAAAHGLEVELYDPFDQEAVRALLSRLRRPGRHLVVGHSNTTPGFTRALGGDAISGIGEGEYDRVYVVVPQDDGALSTLLRYGAPSGLAGTARPVPTDPDPSRIREGRLVFRMSFNGDSAGVSVNETRREGEGWRMRESSALEGFQVDAVNEVVLGPDLRPITFTSQGTMFGNPVEIDVAFTDDRATGSSLFPRQAGPEVLEIDTGIPSGTLERTSVFFVSPALPFERGGALGLNWFDTYSGQVQPIAAVVTGEERIEVPAGAFDSWRVELRGGTPSQVLWVTRSAPHHIVRIEVVGQPWVYELLDVEWY